MQKSFEARASEQRPVRRAPVILVALVARARFAGKLLAYACACVLLKQKIDFFRDSLHYVSRVSRRADCARFV